ncbi:hypothetical protein PAPYR_8460 [Paratrimastix pyriformis]|uniref:Uncharacterized protein n=1 Tax=Paratrimastix pyriformis TaxID=342808 RepID=A0ABQ8UAL2_9EUKA|nr:hypothetical protein PAPYR_8460 [Paratrimastix pyriformis]
MLIAATRSLVFSPASSEIAPQPIPAESLAALVGPCQSLECLVLSDVMQCGRERSVYGPWVAQAFADHPRVAKLAIHGDGITPGALQRILEYLPGLVDFTLDIPAASESPLERLTVTQPTASHRTMLLAPLRGLTHLCLTTLTGPASPLPAFPHLSSLHLWGSSNLLAVPPLPPGLRQLAIGSLPPPEPPARMGYSLQRSSTIPSLTLPAGAIDRGRLTALLAANAQSLERLAIGPPLTFSNWSAFDPSNAPMHGGMIAGAAPP